jgi:hypothetical protein
MHHLRNTFGRINDHSMVEIHHAFHPRKSMAPDHKPTCMAIISYMQTISGKISRLLAMYNIKTIHRLVKKTNNMRKPEKVNLGRNMLGIYCILCECGKVYVGQAGRTVTARCKERECHLQPINQRNLRLWNIAHKPAIKLVLVRSLY